MGFTVLFGLVGAFTYVSFYLTRPPFHLSTAALGSVFFVYLLGCIVTPLAGRFLDSQGFRPTVVLSVGLSISGLLLTLVPFLPVVIAGLALFASGVFVSQSAATVLTGQVAGHARSAAAGLYVTFYYTGGSVGSMATAWFWLHGGWLSCVGLFAGVSLATLGFSSLGGRSVAGGGPGGPRVDTAI
jgi:MFS family permease